MTEKIYISLMLAALLSVTEAAIPRDQCQLFCTRIGFPVCGSDGRTYGNPCELRAENCLKSPYQQVTLVRNGTCDTTTTYPQTVSRPTSTKCTLVCTDDYTPVCGSDGKTYSNACQVRVRNCRGSPYDQITIVSNGTCETTTPATTTTTSTTSYQTTSQVNPPRDCPDVCFFLFDPVCGSDGKTYGNRCLLGIENCKRFPYDQVVVVRNGSCDTTPTTTTPATYQQTSQANPHRDCPDACIFLFDPVCGSDGKTYGNLCLLGIENCKRFPYDQVVVVRNGSCDTTPTTTTPATYQQTEPVNPYGSSCNLACTRELNQVCGSDGNTYNNPCLLRVGNCERSPYNQVVLVRNGSCDTTRTTSNPSTYRQTVPYPTPTACSLVCTDDYTPVCGSDGKTYSNACQVRVRNCRGSAYDQVTIASNGTCETATTTITTSTSRYPTIEPVTTPDACPGIYQRTWDPVCGSDGNEYRNPCVLRAENCFRSPYQQITKVSNGSCEALTSTNNPKTVPEPLPTDCSLAYSEVYAPVCGSDGNTYSNACQLRERNCRGSPDNQITIVSNGSCETTTTTRTSTSTSRYPTVYP